jgi:energy-coupling factor transport system ATP-binding protein
MGAFVYTIDERQLLDGLSDLLIVIALIKKSVVRNIVLVVGIIFRFIPLLMEEASSIVKTQIIRGAFAQSKGFKKFRQIIPLFAPLMIQTFRKAELFAQALTARYFR